MTATRQWNRFILVPAALAMLIAGSATPPAAAQQATPEATIILDSSRSMWGQIDGVNKVVSARNVLDQAAKQYQGKIHLGLVSYGHRKSAGCSDIEVLLEPGPREAEVFSERVHSIKPRGSTPIASALETAAEAARSTQKKTSLLLLSDGLDNCDRDPCAVAGTLESKSERLSIHVVAFDRNRQEELEKLRCVAEATGGSFASATSEPELHEAVTAALAKVAAPPPPAPERPPETDAPRTARSDARNAQAQEEVAAAPADPQPDEPESGEAVSGEPAPVELRARLVEGGATLDSALVWRIFEPEPTDSGKYRLLGTHRAATMSDKLAPGEYLVNAAYGLANLTKKIRVRDGQPLENVFVLNAGGLRLDAALPNGESIPPNSVRYDIFAGDPDQFGNREKVIGDAKPGLVIRLNAGAYHIVSVYGDANAVVRADVTVEPGRLTEATINHSAAKVTFKLVRQPGGEALADTRWSVLTPGGDTVKESAGALPTHILAAGEYSVLASHDGEKYDRNFEVTPGEAQQIEVVIR